MIVDIGAIELGTGMKYDGDTSCFTGVFSGYTFVLSVLGGEGGYKLEAWVIRCAFPDGQSIDSFLGAFSETELSPLKEYSCDGSAVLMKLAETDDIKFDCEEISAVIHHFAAFLSAGGYKDCCADCGGTAGLALAQHGGRLIHICAHCMPKYREETVPEAGYVVDETLERDERGYISPRKTDVDFTAEQHGIFEIQQNLEKKSNILFGIMGALAACAASSAAWIILGQTRFLPLVSPLILVFLCVFAYRFSAGVLDMRGVVICASAIFVTVPLAELGSNLLYIWTELDSCGGVLSLPLAFEWLADYLSSSVFSSAFSINIFIGYTISAVAFVFYANMKYMKIRIKA